MAMKDYWNEGPKGEYHRQCYQEYKDINKVMKAKQKQGSYRKDGNKEPVEQSNSVEPPPKRVCRSQLQKI